MGGDAHEFVLLLVHLAQLLAGMLEFQVSAHTGQQFGRIERLGHVIDRPHFEALDQMLHLVAGGEENDRNVLRRRIGFEAPADFQPVHFRHHQVQQDKIRQLHSQRHPAPPRRWWPA